MARMHYRDELELVRQHLIEMGETTIHVYNEALAGIGKCSREAAERAQELETQTDHQNRMIHEECLSLITLQAPVARDARLVTAILDAIVDLELIADYANEIVGLGSAKQGRLPSQILVQISEIGAKIKEILSIAIDSWRNEDRGMALSARPRVAAIRAECRALADKVSLLTSAPGDVTAYVNMLLICRHLERIMRHAVCVAEQAAEAAPPAPAG